VIYQMTEEETPKLSLLAGYADDAAQRHPARIGLGEGMIAQCALDKRKMVLVGLPKRSAAIGSALFRVTPRNIIVLPVLFENKVKAVIELASIAAFTDLQIVFLEQLTA